MADRSRPVQDSIDAQAEVFRLARKDHGLTLAYLASRHPDLHVSTMTTWAKGTVIPGWAIGALSKAGIPDDVLSLIYEPFQGHYGTDDDEDALSAAIDQAAQEANAFAGEVLKLRAKGGICHRGRAHLAQFAGKVISSLRKVRR